MPAQRPSAPRRPPPPLDAAALDRLALHYVGRYATTRGRLARYLQRKVRERGWEGEGPAISELADRLAGLGYIDDLGFAKARAGALARRGLGSRRVEDVLRADGIVADDRTTLAPDIAAAAVDAALAFARRKRLGPFAAQEPDRDLRAKQLAAMLRAGHGFALSRRILGLSPGSDAAFLADSSESAMFS